jgi:hypothetical protein
MKKLSAWSTLAVFSIVFKLYGAEKPVEAGDGNYDRFWLPSSQNSSQDKFNRRDSYVRVSVVNWFANKDSSWWKERMASATCQVSLGDETYDVALGTLTLKGGAFTAPVFDKVIVDNRLWVGGDLKVKVFFKASQADTVLAGILRDMAKSSLGIASSAVEGYAAKAASGPYAPLLSAGQSLVSSVQSLISSAPKPLPIFELDGFDVTAPTPLSDLRGKVNYLLLVRANLLLTTKDSIQIIEDGNVASVLSNGMPLRDGAWMLLKIVNENVYGRARIWEDDSDALQIEIGELISQVKNRVVSKQDALSKLQPSNLEGRIKTPTKSQSLGDRILDIESLISHDRALSKAERTTESGKLTSVWSLAMAACKSTTPAAFANGTNNLFASLQSGTPPKNDIVRGAFRHSRLAIEAIDEPDSKGLGQGPTDEQIWKTGREIYLQTERRKKEQKETRKLQ